MKKIFSYILVFLLAFAMSGCGNGNDSSSKDTKISYQSNYQKADNIPQNASSFQIAHDRIWFLVSGAENYIGSVDLSGADFKKIALDEPKNKEYSNLHVMQNKSILVAMNDNDTKSESGASTLIKLDADGKEQSRKDLDTFADSIMTDKDNNIFVGGFDKIVALNPEGENAFELKTEGAMSMALSKDNDVLVVAYGDKGQEIRTIDFNAKAFGKEKILIENGDRDTKLLTGNSKNSFILLSDGQLQGYVKDTKKFETILSFSDIDMFSEQVQAISSIEDEKFICVARNKDKFEIHDITKSENKNEKTTLTLAAFTLMPDIQNRIVEFNRTNPKYRIEVLDYSKYDTRDDRSAGLTKLNTDIISGNTPDIIELSQIPVEKYIKKGLFEDLNKHFESDSDIKKEDIIPGALNALSSEDGMFSLAPNFTTMSLYGRESQIGDAKSWGLKDVQELLNSRSDVKEPLANVTAERTLFYLSMFTMNQFIDSSSGACNFDSEDFIALLELAKKNKMDPEAGYKEPAEQLLNEQSLFSILYMSSITNYQSIDDALNGDLNVIGFPTTEGNGHVADFEFSFAIFNDSKYKDASFEFLKSFLDEEYQEKVSKYAIPVLKSAYDKMLEDAKNPKDPEKEGMTEEQIAGFDNIVNSITQSYSFDGTLMKIITDEAQDFFNDRRSAKEVSDSIQSRAKLYISESR